MRRLTLILSDLYLPVEADNQALPDTVELPNFEWLLRMAGAMNTHTQWRWQVAAQAGRADLAGLEPAHLVARERFPQLPVAGCWFATPVNLEVRLDHVRLPHRGLLSLSEEERLAWCSEFARAFGPELQLHDTGPRGFLMSGLNAANALTSEPARLLDCDVAAGLPRGADSAPLRRLSAEIEMWAHGAALNRERERRRQRVVSALWLWGGGTIRGDAPAAGGAARPIAWAGEDACLGSLSRLITGAPPGSAPDALADFAADAAHRIIELAPMTDARHSLAQLDAHWFGPAREALTNGSLDLIDIFANDRSLQITRRDRLRFWRRPRNWLQSLGRTARMPKA